MGVQLRAARRGHGYRLPTDGDLPERIASVRSVLYLIHNAGVDSPAPAPLRSEAIRLARALVELLPDEPEPAGLLALMLLSDARAPTRLAGGSPILLRDQDRSRWNQDLIAEGHAIVRACIRRARPGLYQLQAAIHAVHCYATEFEETDWPQIVALYDHLYTLMPTPVVALNRAIAIAETEGPESALDLINNVTADLDNYHLMHAARGTYPMRLGHRDTAKAAFERALSLAGTDAERRFLEGQIAGLTNDIPSNSPAR